MKSEEARRLVVNFAKLPELLLSSLDTLKSGLADNLRRLFGSHPDDEV